jgi:hypothetical protein
VTPVATSCHDGVHAPSGEHLCFRVGGAED